MFLSTTVHKKPIKLLTERVLKTPTIRAMGGHTQIWDAFMWLTPSHRYLNTHAPLRQGGQKNHSEQNQSYWPSDMRWISRELCGYSVTLKLSDWFSPDWPWLALTGLALTWVFTGYHNDPAPNLTPSFHQGTWSHTFSYLGVCSQMYPLPWPSGFPTLLDSFHHKKNIHDLVSPFSCDLNYKNPIEVLSITAVSSYTPSIHSLLTPESSFTYAGSPLSKARSQALSGEGEGGAVQEVKASPLVPMCFFPVQPTK